MLLRDSISSTKKFFQKTIDNVKSFLSKTPYERLPKTPPFYPFSCGRRRKMEIHIAAGYKDTKTTDINTDYSSSLRRRRRHHKYDFADNQWSLSKSSTTTEAVDDDQKRKRSAAAEGKENYQEQKLTVLDEKARGSPLIKEEEDHNIDHNERRQFGRGRNIINGGGRTCFRDTRKMNSWVTQKLKEFEMVDRSNIDHLLDIEEVLHYYSRLTCPAYLEMVDNFFVEMYAEFCDGPPQSVPAGGT